MENDLMSQRVMMILESQQDRCENQVCLIFDVDSEVGEVAQGLLVEWEAVVQPIVDDDDEVIEFVARVPLEKALPFLVACYGHEIEPETSHRISRQIKNRFCRFIKAEDDDICIVEARAKKLN